MKKSQQIQSDLDCLVDQLHNRNLMIPYELYESVSLSFEYFDHDGWEASVFWLPEIINKVISWTKKV